MAIVLSWWTWAWVLAVSGAVPLATAPSYAPGTANEYRLDAHLGAGDLERTFIPSQMAILEKLNRADVTHLSKLEPLVVPTMWWEDDLQYSPFPLHYQGASTIPRLLVIDLPSQAFAAYEDGRLLRWGPISSGRRSNPTPSGLFRLNWRSPGRYSTINPAWYLKSYFNFDNDQGLALHAYALPGHPASHGCVRLLERDARWVYEWGTPGTPLIITGQYTFNAPPLWRSIEHLRGGIILPASPVSAQ